MVVEYVVSCNRDRHRVDEDSVTGSLRSELLNDTFCLCSDSNMKYDKLLVHDPLDTSVILNS